MNLFFFFLRWLNILELESGDDCKYTNLVYKTHWLYTLKHYFMECKFYLNFLELPLMPCMYFNCAKKYIA